MRLSPFPLESQHHNSFSSSLNSIDENKSTDDLNNLTFAKKRCPDVYSSSLPDKRQSDPAIRFSFYNKLFEMSDGSQHLSPPEKDFRKYSLPSSMTSLHDQPISSLTRTSWLRNKKVKGMTTSKSQDSPLQFKWIVNDETGRVMRDFLSPMEDFIDEQCLHFEENFVNIREFETSFEVKLDNFEELDEKFKRINNESFFQSQTSTETVINTETICKKCGHDILKL